VNSLPKTVTRQRRDCNLNLGPTAPESSSLTTRLPSHHIVYYTVRQRSNTKCNTYIQCTKQRTKSSNGVYGPAIGHAMDVPSSFISVLRHSDRLYHGESCPRLDVVHPGRAWPSSPKCTWHCSLHYLFLQATLLFPHGVTIVASFLALTVSNSSLFTRCTSSAKLSRNNNRTRSVRQADWRMRQPGHARTRRRTNSKHNATKGRPRTSA